MSEISQLFDVNGQFGQDPALRQPPQFVQGKVTDNADKQNAGMVKVEFLSWKSGSNICQWMPLLRPYAGAGYGLYAVPEVGDIVLVGFLGSEMRRPFVMGVLYPAGAKYPGQQFTEKNFTKSFRTKGGCEVTFSDEQNKEKVTVATPGGLQVDLDDGAQAVTVTDKNGKNLLKLDCKNGQASLTANAEITLKTGSCTLTMDGQSGKIQLEGNTVAVSAKQQFTAEGKAGLSLTSSASAKLEGTAGLTLKSSAMAQLSGSMVKIN